MKSSTKRLTSAFVALLLFVGAFVIFFDFVQPAYGDLMATRGQLSSQQQTLDNESKTITQIKAVVAKYADQVDAQNQVGAALPMGANLANAVTQIYGLAQANGISVQNIGISVANTGSGARSAPTANLAVRPTGTIAFAVSAVGPYEGFLSFLSGIETNLRIFDVKQISIQSTPSTGAKAAVQNLFNYNVTVNTYYQIP